MNSITDLIPPLSGKPNFTHMDVNVKPNEAPKINATDILNSIRSSQIAVFPLYPHRLK